MSLADQARAAERDKSYTVRLFSQLADRIEALEARNMQYREALEIIAGKRQCLDNLMSNQDVALATLRDGKMHSTQP